MPPVNVATKYQQPTLRQLVFIALVLVLVAQIAWLTKALPIIAVTRRYLGRDGIPIPRGMATGGRHRGGEMLTVTCLNRITGLVRVQVPVKYRALVSRYATFGELYGTDAWMSDTPYTTWLQLPGVVVER